MPNMWMDVDTQLDEVPVNIAALTDDTDFKTREESVVFNQAGMDLVWNFTNTNGDTTQTAVTPTDGGDYDWTNLGNGMYAIALPDSGGASVDNDATGFGWFSGFATGILPWSGPVIGFRTAIMNAAMVDGTFLDANGRVDVGDWLGLAVTLSDNNKPDVNVDEWADVPLGTTNPLPNAAADGAGGLPVSDAGGLDLDTLLGVLTSLAAETRSANLLDQLKTIIAVIESQRGKHTHQPGTGAILFIDDVNGDTHANGNRGGVSDPYTTYADAETSAGTDFGHDLYIFVAGTTGGVSTHTEEITVNNGYSLLRGPGRGQILTSSGAVKTINVVSGSDGVELSGFQITSDVSSGQDALEVTDSDFHRVHNCWFLDTRGDGIHLNRSTNCQIHNNHFEGTGTLGSAQGVHILGTGGDSSDNAIFNNHFANTGGTAILVQNGTINDTDIHDNTIHNAGGWAIDIGSDSNDAQVYRNTLGNNSSGNINDGGTTSIIQNNYDVAFGVADEVLTGATHNVSSSFGRRIREIHGLVGNEGAAVWFDSVNGASGTAEENGIATNPSNNIDDTLTMLAARGYARVKVASGSTVTLTDDLEGIEIFDGNWSLELEGFSISNSCIIGASVTGIATGAISPKLIGCQFGAVTLPPCVMNGCGIGASNGTFTFGGAGQYDFFQCRSLVPGAGTPNFIATGLGSATGIGNRAWFGGANYTLDSDITLSHEVVGGGGTTVTTGGADVEIRGITRSVTLVLSNAGTVQFVGITGPVTISGTATTTVNLYGVSSSLTDTSSGVTINDETTSQVNSADALLNRGASNIEDTADRHSLGAVVMIATNSSIAGTTLTAKKPSDDSTFATYTVTVDAGGDPITGIS